MEEQPAAHDVLHRALRADERAQGAEYATRQLKQRVIMRGGIALTPVGRPSGLTVRREDNSDQEKTL